MNGTTIDKIGVEFTSKISPDFGVNVIKAVKDIEEKIDGIRKQLSSRFKDFSVQMTTAFNVLREMPVLQLARMIDTSGVVDKGVSSFRDMREKSLAEFEAMSSGILKEVNRLKNEFAKLQKWIDELKAGEIPVVGWGPMTKAGKFPPIHAISQEMQALAPEEEIRAEMQRLIAEYAQRQLDVYKQMEGLVGRLGAFEQARIATTELVARQVQQEAEARARVADFVKVTQELLQRGMLAEGVDQKKLSQMKQYLDELIKTEGGRNALSQQLDNILKEIIKDEEQIKNIVMETLGVRKEDLLTEEKILALAEQIKEQYAQARAAGAGGIGGPGGGDEWNRLIGTIRRAKDEVSKFQQAIQQIQMRAYIRPDEFERVTNLAKAINSEIDRLANQIARLGSQTEAAKIAAPFDALQKQIDQVKVGLKEGTLQNVDQAVRQLADDLKKLALVGKEFQLQGVRAGLEAVNKEIIQLTGGVEINLRSIKKLGMGTLELEKLQGLLAEKMKLIRQEFQLTGVATAEMNTQMKATGESLVMVGHHQASFARRTGDALRALDRWGAGFKDMLKSQMAWMIGGALLFGTIFKIKSALTETIDTMFKFKQAIIDVGAITEATASEMGLLEQAARDVATSTKMGFMEAAEALKILGQAGLTARQSAEVLKTVAMLVTATGASSQDAVKVLTTAMNVWNLSAKEATRVGNVLAAALNYSKLEVGDLSVAFNYLAATAAQVGMSIEETAATIAVLSNAGIRASTIGTGLRGVISQLIAPTKAFKEQIEAVGLEIEDIQIPGNNLIEVLRKLTKAGFDLGNVFEGLEKRQAGALMAMLNMGAETFNRMTERITGTNAMMVMFERSMEGPVNRLIVFKNKLLDVGLGLSDIIIPSFMKFIDILALLPQTIKDIGPLIGALGLASLFKYLGTAVDVAGVSMSRFMKILGWIKGHPIFAAISLLIVSYTGLKYALEAESRAREQKMKEMDREIAMIIKQSGELEHLITILKSKETKESEAREMIKSLVEHYETLRESIKGVGVDSQKAIEIAIKELEKLDAKLKELKLDRFALEAQKYFKALDEIRRKEEAYIEGAEARARTFKEAGLKLDDEKVKKYLKEFEMALTGLKEKSLEAEESLKPLYAIFLDLSEAEFKAAMGLRGFNEEQIKILESLRQRIILEREAGKITKGVEEEKRATAELLELLKEWRKKAADERKKIDLEEEEALKKIKGKTKEAEEARLLIRNYYHGKRKELDEKEAKERMQLEKNFQDYYERWRKEGYRRELQEAELYGDERSKIQKRLETRLLEIEAEYFDELRKIDEDVSAKKIAPEKVRELRFQADYQRAQKVLFEEAQTRDKLRKLEEAEEKKHLDFMFRIREETARSLIAIAKTMEDEIGGIEKAFSLKRQSELEKHEKNKIDIGNRYKGQDLENNKKYQEEMEWERHRHLTVLDEIEEKKQKDITETRTKHERERIKRAKELAEIEIEGRNRLLQDELKIRQQQYDEMSEMDRQSNVGKKLKYDIDKLTVSITENTIAILENQKEWLKAQPQTDITKLAIAEVAEKIDRYSEKLRSSRRSMAEFEGSQRGLIAGLIAGWKNFWNTTENLFEAGQQFFKNFNAVIKNSFSELFEDALVGNLKSFKDYFNSFARSLARIWSDLMADMIKDWLKMQLKTTGKNWLTSIVKVIGGAVGGAVGGASSWKYTSVEGAGYAGGEWYHGGGSVVKKHTGGMESDEVIARLLANEYVIRSKSAQSIGKQNLDYMNETGKLPRQEKIPVEIQIFNVLDPADVVARGIAENEAVIINPVVSSYNRNAEMRKTIMVDR